MINYECSLPGLITHADEESSSYPKEVRNISICIINYLPRSRSRSENSRSAVETSVRPRIPRGMTRVKSRTHTSEIR